MTADDRQDDYEDDRDDDRAPGALDVPGMPEFDISALVEQAQQMQSQLLDAQAQAAEQVVEGHAGGGVVKVEVTGGLEFRRVTIDPKVVDPADVAMLEDLVLAAVRDAVTRIEELKQEALGGLGGLAGGLGGLLG